MFCRYCRDCRIQDHRLDGIVPLLDCLSVFLSENGNEQYHFSLNSGIGYISLRSINTSTWLDSAYYEGNWLTVPDYFNLTPIDSGYVSQIRLDEIENTGMREIDLDIGCPPDPDVLVLSEEDSIVEKESDKVEKKNIDVPNGRGLIKPFLLPKP